MKKAFVVFGLLLSMYWGYGWFTSPNQGPVRVRFTNATDDTGVKIWFIAYDRASSVELSKGKQEINEKVLSGERAFVVYEPLNETIVATGKHTLRENSDKNLDVVVKGSKKKGYTIVFEEF